MPNIFDPIESDEFSYDENILDFEAMESFDRGATAFEFEFGWQLDLDA